MWIRSIFPREWWKSWRGVSLPRSGPPSRNFSKGKESRSAGPDRDQLERTGSVRRARDQRLKVNARAETNVPGLYAAGDGAGNGTSLMGAFVLGRVAGA